MSLCVFRAPGEGPTDRFKMRSLTDYCVPQINWGAQLRKQAPKAAEVYAQQLEVGATAATAVEGHICCMSFLAKALHGGGSTAEPALKPEQLGSIRVAVVGDPAVGKTALTELIASGAPSRTAARSTAGCHIHVKLVDNTAAAGAGAAVTTSGSGGGGLQHGTPQQLQASTSGGSLTLNFAQQDPRTSLPAQHKFFVELWDISGQPKYSQLRSVFFKQLNGVILVYDVTNKGSLARLQKWAAEVAHDGSFVAPLADELAARNVGGLPVPVLVIGNKADRLGFSSHAGGQAVAHTLSAFLNGACTQALLGPTACSSWWPQQLLRRLTGWRGPRRRPPSESSLAAAAAEAGLEPHLLGLTTSAATGDLAWEQLNGFFRSLWQRRYQPATAAAGSSAGWALGSKEPMGGFTGHPALVMGVPAGAAATATVALAEAGGGGAKQRDDARLDDCDWV